MYLSVGCVSTHEVVHANVDPRDYVLLRDVFAVEELVEVDNWIAGKMQVPH